MPMVNEKEIEIRERLIQLLKPQIEDEEYFRKEFFFHRSILGQAEMESLIDSEKEQYTEKGTLRLAEILFELSKAPPSTSYTPDGGKIHFSYKVHISKEMYGSFAGFTERTWNDYGIIMVEIIKEHLKK